MAPMITSVEEIVQFKSAVARAIDDLTRNSVAFHSQIKIGMMVEVPSVAFLIDHLSEHVDFFSIGTNDLSQYFFAADRTNPRMASLFNPRHPAFLRFLSQLVDQIRSKKKWVGMCGDMASDIRNLPLLLGLGLDEISVPAAEVNELKRSVTNLDTSQCAGLLHRAMQCENTADIDSLLTLRQSKQAEPLLTEELVLLGSSSQSKEEVIQEMVDAFYICDRTDHRHLLEEALWARESIYSTGLGFGFATPHCKTDAITADSICVLRLDDPINWDSIDGERVRMVVLLALRNSDAANTHMQVFSTLARKLMTEDFRQRLLEVKSAREATTYLAEQLGLPS
jgi:fructose-specific phosphotransferase system IIA component